MARKHTTEKVVSLQEAREDQRWDQLRGSVDPNGLFVVPMDDIVQISESANEALTNPVHLGPRAERALQALVDEFCLERLPKTLAEVQAVMQYGWFLQGKVRFGLKTFKEDEEIWNGSVDKVMTQYAPSFLEPVQAYREGNREALLRVHKERLTLDALAKRVEIDGGFRFYELDK
jgi:hypothetical protein